MERERSKNWLENRMKFALPIQFFQAGCVAAAIAFGMMRAEAQITPPSTNYIFPAIGTLQKVTDYAARATTYVGIFAWAYKTNGQEADYGSMTRYIGTNIMTSKTQLDQQFIVPALSNIAIYNFCTNANPVWDKSKGVIIYIGCIISDPNFDLSQDALWYSDTIQLVKNSDGSWSVPNLSNFSTQLGDPMPFYIPSLQWARVEIGSNGCSFPFEIDDNQYKPGSSLLSSDGFLYLPTGYITNSSSSGGGLWMKISLVDAISLIPRTSGTSNLFQIFNGDGNIVPETPMVLALNQSGTNATVTVNGGDSGRGFVLQSSAALTAWTNCSPVTFISPTNDSPNALPAKFVYPSTNRSLFFRTATTNSPPT